MNIPSLSRRRSEPAPTDDVNGDGRVDGRDQAAATVENDERPAVTDRAGDRTTYRSNTATVDGERTADAERRAAERGAGAETGRPIDDAAGRTPTGRVAPVDDESRRTPVLADPVAKRTLDRKIVDADGDGRPEPEVPVVAGPRPRASLLATLGLIASVAGALFVLTGTLAGYGIALGGLGAVLSVLGLIATRRRHIAGKTDALIGILLGLGAVVLGVLAMTGLFDWPTTDGEWVQRFREWLDSQFAGRF